VLLTVVEPSGGNPTKSDSHQIAETLNYELCVPGKTEDERNDTVIKSPITPGITVTHVGVVADTILADESNVGKIQQIFFDPMKCVRTSNGSAVHFSPHACSTQVLSPGGRGVADESFLRLRLDESSDVTTPGGSNVSVDDMQFSRPRDAETVSNDFLKPVGFPFTKGNNAKVFSKIFFCCHLKLEQSCKQS